MNFRPLCGALLAAMAAHGTPSQAQGCAEAAPETFAAPAPCAAPAPFAAHYEANWKSINVGTSDLKLERGAEPGSYLYTWTITARGIFRLAYRNDVVQKSWLSMHDDHIRPDKYRAQEGSSSVSLDFDWDGKRARGTSESKPVDLHLHEAAQDVMSVQVEVMIDLKKGTLPKSFQIVDKDEAKEFLYAVDGKARIRTALGELDTIVVSSRRAGGNRILQMWFAPALGFAPVQAERTRDGNLEFSMRIKRLQR